MTETQPSPTRLWPRRVWRFVRVVLLAYLGVVLLFAVFENSLVYFPTQYPHGDWSLESGVEDAWFDAADGTKLHGWLVEVEQPRAVVLFSHGNGGSIAGRRGMFEMFRALRVTAMMWSYPGYGRSEGTPNEAGVLQAARAARAWLAGRMGIKESEIVLWGESLGGGVSVDLAQDGARGLILENTFTSLPDVATFHYPWLPTRSLMQNRFESIAKIGKYHGPLLQFHGDADTIVPYSLGEKLFAAANEPKQFVTVEGADHNDPRDERMFRAVDRFFQTMADPTAVK